MTADDLRPVRGRARLIAPELSAEEAAVVARFDAADDAPESLRERLAQALYESRGPWEDVADVAIAVMRGQQ